MKIFLSSNPFVKNPNLENRLDMRSLCDVGLVHTLLCPSAKIERNYQHECREELLHSHINGHGEIGKSPCQHDGYATLHGQHQKGAICFSFPYSAKVALSFLIKAARVSSMKGPASPQAPRAVKPTVTAPSLVVSTLLEICKPKGL